MIETELCQSPEANEESTTKAVISSDEIIKEEKGILEDEAALEDIAEVNNENVLITPYVIAGIAITAFGIACVLLRTKNR